MRIDIEPLSVNDAWQGKRYPTDEYTKYVAALCYKYLPASLVILKGNLKLDITWGFSSKGSDIDNPTKPFVDTLTKKYGFNDNRIYELNLKKEIVPKGKEFIDFTIASLE